MSSDWMNKAKEAAKRAGEEAKKLADTAKNANYGEMLDKTKNIAKQAAEEAKKAAGNIMNKDKAQNPPAPDLKDTVEPQQPTETAAPQPTAETQATAAPQAKPAEVDEGALIVAKLDQMERLLSEIKQLLK